MTDTAVRIHSYQVPEKRLGVFFMGQAGVILKAPDNTLLAVDLYLSDCCEDVYKRQIPLYNRSRLFLLRPEAKRC